MNEVLITSISFIAAILVSIYVAFAGIAYYSSWEQKRLAEKEKIDRIKFGIDQEDVMVPVQGSKAVDYYKHQFVEYSHEYLKNRMADLIGNIMKVIDGALVLISLIYTAALVYLSISKGINSALLIWVMPSTLIVTCIIKQLVAQSCNFLTGRMPLEPYNTRNPAQRRLNEIEGT